MSTFIVIAARLANIRSNAHVISIETQEEQRFIEEELPLNPGTEKKLR